MELKKKLKVGVGGCRKIPGYKQSGSAAEIILECVNELNLFFNKFDHPTPMSSAGKPGSTFSRVIATSYTYITPSPSTITQEDMFMMVLRLLKSTSINR